MSRVWSAIGDNGPVVVYDIWGNWNPTFVKDSALTLGFNVDFGYNGASGSPARAYGHLFRVTVLVGDTVYDSNTWWGAALYASVQVHQGVHPGGSW